MRYLQKHVLIVISVWFQCVWFLAVLGRETMFYYLIPFICLGLYLIAKLYRIQWSPLVALLFVGLLVDSCNQALGLLEFSTQWLPSWLLALWVAFSLYAFVLLPQLNRFPKWAVLCVGGLGGSLSYLAGLKFGAVTTTFSKLFFVSVLFVEWVLLLVIASLLIARFPLVQKELRE
ncbi:DUF2878 family protein [Vibrio astriarenae]|uniref:DUF2878 family protein n=1 Tax=Vibrio astriarenae TaxID=1481923 RepID=A0A7Z2YD30_9VIBR|nr:DUF2878 domain-containing protein [Vibrio astriarenae]QIA62926.1 DUF2878 family protein [Vibrio astriarenae]